jgi:hypothetical protein
MTHIKDALENVKTTASSGVDPAFVSLSSSLVPMVSGIESVITSIKSINSKIKKLV